MDCVLASVSGFCVICMWTMILSSTSFVRTTWSTPRWRQYGIRPKIILQPIVRKLHRPKFTMWRAKDSNWHQVRRESFNRLPNSRPAKYSENRKQENSLRIRWISWIMVNCIRCVASTIRSLCSRIMPGKIPFWSYCCKQYLASSWISSTPTNEYGWWQSHAKFNQWKMSWNSSWPKGYSSTISIPAWKYTIGKFITISYSKSRRCATLINLFVSIFLHPNAERYSYSFRTSSGWATPTKKSFQPMRESSNGINSFTFIMPVCGCMHWAIR